jgi:hypothetical protein
MKAQFKEERKETPLEGSGATWGGQWAPGEAPSQGLTSPVQVLAKAGTLSTRRSRSSACIPTP